MSEEAQSIDEALEHHLNMAIESAADVGDFVDEDTDTDEAASESAASTEGQPGTGAQSVEGTDENTGGEPAQEGQPEGDPSPKQPTLSKDEHGNILEDGQIVARAGAERRMYEKMQRVQDENNTLNTQLDTFSQIQQHASALQVSPQEIQFGIQMMADLRTKPVETMRMMLSEAMKKGYNLADIVGQQEGLPSSSVDMGAIGRMIDDKLGPIVGQYNAQQQQHQQMEEVQRAYENFISTHDFADVHIDAIQHLLQNNRELTSERAYYELKTFANENGLDFSKPLAPQLEAKAQAVQQPPENPVRKPMPDGSGSSAIERQPTVASGDDDWDSIVRSSMNEAGLRY